LTSRNTNAGIVIVGLLAAFGISCVLADEPTSKAVPTSEKTANQRDDDSDQLSTPTTLEAARDRAILMHKIYLSTLEVMHDRYFHVNRAVLPARALEDVFDDIADQTRIQARWISVNTPAMSVSHEPRDAFEKRAAAEIAGGRAGYESLEEGVYRRAAAVPLDDGCISCHTGFFKDEPATPRFAGLVVRIPLRSKAGDQD